MDQVISESAWNPLGPMRRAQRGRPSTDAAVVLRTALEYSIYIYVYIYFKLCMLHDKMFCHYQFGKYLLKGAVTCAVCPESAWLVIFLIGNVSTGVVTWSALRCGASGKSGKKVATAPLSKTAAAAAAAKTWFAKHPLDYMQHNRFPWKRSGRRSSMWPPYRQLPVQPELF